MDETIFASVYLGDARLAAHASSATAVWLWSADGARILWANPAGCAALGAKTPQALLERAFAIGDPARTHIERLADTLPAGAGARLFRLRGFAGAAWSSLTCSCARFDRGRTAGILVIATESVGAEVPLAERVRRLGFPEKAAIAAYAQDGEMLFATAAAERRLAGASGLDAIGAASLATAALATGSARGDTRIGPVVLQRIGRGASTVLLAGFPDPVAAPSPASGGIKPASAAEASQPARPAAPDPKSNPTSNPARRRHPLRFVWQMDTAGRFSLGSEEFAGIIGTGAEIVSGRPWPEINAELGLDPAGRVGQAIASRETWSNITVSWPIDGSDQRLEVELAGLPAFDRSRNFLGYRGFGVCRDIAQIERLATMRQLTAFAPVLPAAKESALPPRSREPVSHEAAPVSSPEAASSPKPTASVTARMAAPIAPNVVRFPGAAAFADLRGAEPESPALSAGEHSAFHELARQLSVRLQTGEAAPEESRPPLPANLSGAASTGRLSPAAQIPARAAAWMFDEGKPVFAADDHPLLNRLPVGILVYRYEEILFANRAFLAWTGYPDLQALRMAGGLDALFLDAGVGALADTEEGGKRLAIATRDGDKVPFEGRLFAIQWDGESAFAVLLFKTAAHEQIRAAEAAVVQAEALTLELGMLLDRVADAILVVDRAGAIVSSHGGGKAFFGRGGRALAGAAFESLFAPDARNTAAGQLARVVREGGTVSAELTALAGNGELRPMLVTIARIGRASEPLASEPSASEPSGSERLSVILRDISVMKRAERADAAAPQPAKAGALDTAKALAKLCHDARSPINSIIGFCDIMLAERFGPIGTDRYREYIRDISASGAQVMSRLADAAELAEIIAGTTRLSPVRVSLNEVVNACVTAQQGAASEARVVIRTALSPGLQPVLADAEAVRSMIVNLLGHALQTTRPGGQVIVSTGRSAAGDVVLRIRDSGEGLNERAIEAALQTSPQPPSDRWDASTWDAGARTSGLALTRAIAEANHAQFSITSKAHQGSLFEVTFTTKPESAAPAPGRRTAYETVTKPVDGNR
jgi:signal transduction histidine kinase